MQRRELLRLGASIVGGLATSRVAPALPPAIPVIDTHIHLFDPTRPLGVPWPEKTDTGIYKTTLPDRYARMARPLGIVGAIAVEASPLLSDNDWVLHVVAKYPIMVGMVGDLIPAAASYEKELDRLHRNPLFLGIRYGNLWDRDLAVDAQKPGFLPGLKMLAERGLAMDSANPNLSLIRAVSHVSDHVPELRIVIDHLPTAPVPSEPAARDEYWSLLRHLGQNRNVFVKLSEVLAAKIEEGGRPQLLQRQAGRALGYFRRGSGSLRQRLAKQRTPCDLSADDLGRARFCGEQRAPGNRKIFLEELSCCLPLAQPAGRSTVRVAAFR